MEPTIGRIVHYKHSEQTASLAGGNSRAGDVVPAVIVKVWTGGCLNLQVLNDGPTPTWVTSVMQGDGEYNWQWPVRS